MEFNKTSLDYRAQFALEVCKSHVIAHNGDIQDAVETLEPIYEGFFECVRNIYELVWSEIPLFALFEVESGKMSFEDWEEEESKSAEELTEELYAICEDWYSVEGSEQSALVTLELDLIDSWMPLFEAYPEVKLLPIYAWGRNTYHSAGYGYESFVDVGGVSKFKNYVKGDFDWALLKSIDAKHCIQGGEMWIGDWGECVPDRSEAVSLYGYDEPRGNCIVIVQNDNNTFKIEIYDCYSDGCC